MLQVYYNGQIYIVIPKSSRCKVEHAKKVEDSKLVKKIIEEAKHRLIPDEDINI